MPVLRDLLDGRFDERLHPEEHVSHRPAFGFSLPVVDPPTTLHRQQYTVETEEHGRDGEHDSDDLESDDHDADSASHPHSEHTPPLTG